MDIEGPCMQALWRSDLRMCHLEMRMLWGDMITLFKYLKHCRDAEGLDSSCLAPGGTKQGLMAETWGSGRETTAPCKEGCLARRVSAPRSPAPRSREYWFMPGTGTLAVCPSDRCPHPSQGPSAVGRRGHSRAAVISSKYTFQWTLEQV